MFGAAAADRLLDGRYWTSTDAGERGSLLKRFCNRLWSEDDGQDLIEYVLILVLISVITIAAMKVIGTTLYNAYSSASSNMVSASGQQVDTSPPRPSSDR